MALSNLEVAKKLRNAAAALTIKGGNTFQIRAYDAAADAIEHSTEEAQSLWEEGRLDQIPGIGGNIRAYLDELFRTEEVKHWKQLEKGIPKEVFEFLDIPGVGPKTAMRLSKLGATSIKDLGNKLKNGTLVKKGLSEKMAKKIEAGIGELLAMEKGRMLLPYAFAQSEKVLDYLRKSPAIKRADALGSLRRMVATIGDLDFSVASDKPKEAVEYIAKMPGVARVAEKGEAKITVFLPSGLRLDFLIVPTSTYGALLQHFTGSKLHNIHLRTIAAQKGFSLSERGVKNVKTGEVIPIAREEDLYKILGMGTPPPEIREDIGEIEAALRQTLIKSGQVRGKLGGLPNLIELKDIKGDLHIHSNFPIEPSHDLGSDSIEAIAQDGKRLGYEYIGIADHSPSVTNHTTEQIIKLIKKRSKMIGQINSSGKYIRVINLLEVDIQPDGTLSVPDEGLRLLDFALAGVHSAHRQSKGEMTGRILKALANPYVKVLTHPTGRLLNERESYEADWERIFGFAAKNKKAMEINGYPNRLDLPDTLIRMAQASGVKFTIDTDSHQVPQMTTMRFGVAVARRGWLTVNDTVNAWKWKKFAEWFNIKE